MSKIKILTCYHKPAQLVKSDIIIPIHGGRELTNKNSNYTEEQSWLIDNMIGDDTGDNISDQNPMYSELSVLYWAWKNQNALDNPDYIGLMHYRRWFIFDNIQDIPNQIKSMEGQGWSPGCVSCFNDIEARHFLGTDSTIQDFVEVYDIVLPQYIDIRSIGSSRVRDMHNYLGFKQKDSEMVYEVISQFCSSHKNWSKAKEFLDGYQTSLANMSVMKKELFDEYCEFLFPIITTLKEKFDYSYRSTNGRRFLGYCSEFLLGVFLALKDNLKIRHTQVSFLLDTELQKDILPKFDENATVIGVASDKNYVPYLAVYLQSIIETSQKDNNYDIFILEQDIENQQKDMILQMIEGYSNIAIRFINPEYILSGYHFHIKGSYSRAGFYRLALPLILKNFKKVLYTDIDMIFKQDPSELFSFDLGEYPLAACQDFVYGAYLNYNPTYMAYATNVLELSNPYNYSQAGALLINIPEWLKDNRCEKLIKDASSHHYMIDDQDAINKFFNDEITFLEPKWNAHIISPHLKHLMEFMPAEFIPQINKALKNPGLLHWAAKEKPWNIPQVDKAELWWELARKTPFYEQIIYKNCANAQSKDLDIRYVIKTTLQKLIKSRRIKTILKNIYYNVKTYIIKIRKK